MRNSSNHDVNMTFITYQNNLLFSYLVNNHEKSSNITAENFTRLHLVKLVHALLVLLINNTTANHAIIYTNVLLWHIYNNINIYDVVLANETFV